VPSEKNKLDNYAFHRLEAVLSRRVVVVGSVDFKQVDSDTVLERGMTLYFIGFAHPYPDHPVESPLP
jgi:hypothetical protein